MIILMFHFKGIRKKVEVNAIFAISLRVVVDRSRCLFDPVTVWSYDAFSFSGLTNWSTPRFLVELDSFAVSEIFPHHNFVGSGNFN